MDKAKPVMTTRAERLAMLEFLRVPKHFALMMGQATKGKAMKGGQLLMKAHDHSLMAQYVNKIVGDGSRAWSAQDAKSSKLDSICPHYNDMNALFGERQNFRPSYTLETNNHGRLHIFANTFKFICKERQARLSPLEEAITVLAYNSQAGVTGVEGVVTVLARSRQLVGCEGESRITGLVLVGVKNRARTQERC
ncbi:hypothetical protein DYB37_013771 [Aphanomyces astaci]|uniref:Uncharacterized protein n=1 Tax=Aphanomyces astaci TaxID=112090 RepID=A0A3R7CB12_APHAT|nr:hypothetical protein DYB35_013692 [Aphanomyces astaci]RHZ20644.1 hypothetical protein DYB37_013771 [Aphanomyces astaci]